MPPARGGAAGWGPFDADVWELYDIRSDFTQAHDLAASQPDKLAELKAAFDEEAEKYQVFLLDDRMAERFDASLRPNPLAGKKSFTYGPGAKNLGESTVLSTTGHAFTVRAELQSKARAEGVVAAMGSSTAGWSLYVQKGRPVFAYNFFGVDRTRVAGKKALPGGKESLRVEVVPDEPGPGKPATATLFVNDEQVAQGRLERTVPLRYGVDPYSWESLMERIRRTPARVTGG